MQQTYLRSIKFMEMSLDPLLWAHAQELIFGMYFELLRVNWNSYRMPGVFWRRLDWNMIRFLWTLHAIFYFLREWILRGHVLSTLFLTTFYDDPFSMASRPDDFQRRPFFMYEFAKDSLKWLLADWFFWTTFEAIFGRLFGRLCRRLSKPLVDDFSIHGL